MFDEIIAVTFVRDGVSRRQCLKVAVFDDVDSAPVDDNDFDSDSEMIRCIAGKDDWRFVGKTLRRGDSMRRQDGRLYNIVNVKLDNAIGWLFTARRVK